MVVDLEAFRDWLKAKAPTAETCLMCGSEAVRAATEVVEVRRFQGKDKDPGALAQLVVPMVCGNCGLTLFFDAGMATAVDGAPRPVPL